MELEGLIAYLAKRTTIRGKKALQKLVYFCKEAGVPVRAGYRLYIYGPYSVEVAEDMSEAIAKEIIKLNDDGMGFAPGTTCERFCAAHAESLDAYREKIEEVLRRLGGFTPMRLELYATVHFIAAALQEIDESAGEDRVLEEVLAAKGDKFSPEQVKKAYHDLVAWGWLH
jgi:uncharacterized protein YwgA